MPWVSHYAWNTTNNLSVTSWYCYCFTRTLSSHFENSLSLIIIRSLNLSNFTTFKRRSMSESLWIYRIEKTLRLYSSHKNSQDMKSKPIWKQKLGEGQGSESGFLVWFWVGGYGKLFISFSSHLFRVLTTGPGKKGKKEGRCVDSSY